MANYKTPGVYVEEIVKFPPSVAQVETAIPAFIGYTEKAEKENGDTLLEVPTRITSLLEYETYFGSAANEDTITVEIDDVVDTDNNVARSIKVNQPSSPKPFLMYYSLQMYFANGGGPCYIVSVGLYGADAALLKTSVDDGELTKGLTRLEKEDEPTLILFPDATNISDSSKFHALYNSALSQCNKLQDRFTIIDTKSDSQTDVDSLRNSISSEKDYAKYGAAYYPFLETILSYAYSEGDIAITHTSNDPDALQTAKQNLAKLKSRFVDDLGHLRNRTDILAGTATGELVAAIEFISGGFGGSYNAANASTFIDHVDNVLGRLSSAIADKDAVKAEVTAVLKVISDDGPAAVATKTAIEGAQTTFLGDFEGSGKIDEIYANLVSLKSKLKKDSNAADREATVTTDTSNFQAEFAKLLTYVLGTSISIDLFQHVETNVDAILTIVSAAHVSVLDKNNGSLHARTLQEVKSFDTDSYNRIKNKIANMPLTLPPSSAVAGIYARIDATRGVWKAPANVGVSYVIKPSVQISHEEQADLNVHTTGKSINAIRTFTGKGTLVWGARTLAGNDNEWRYVPVRRFFNMVEESVRKATEQFVFEGNDANTWVRVRAMVENFLVQQWKAGALAGAKTEQAFYVRVGLGQTMTAQDILEGRMIVEIGMAVVRPAEFIILRFSHKMQEA